EPKDFERAKRSPIHGISREHPVGRFCVKDLHHRKFPALRSNAVAIAFEAVPPLTGRHPLGADASKKRQRLHFKGVERVLDRAAQLAFEDVTLEHSLKAQRNGDMHGEKRHDCVDEFGGKTGQCWFGHGTAGVGRWKGWLGRDEGGGSTFEQRRTGLLESSTLLLRPMRARSSFTPLLPPPSTLLVFTPPAQ
ncbi:hypothetical protein BDK51DRAFT_33125, partial [Blyttiomyces helicus]